MRSRERQTENPRMSVWPAIIAFALALPLMGCEWIRKHPPPTCTLHQPTSSQLISVVNHQSQRLQAWRCNDVSVRMHAPRSLPISLDAYLAVKRQNYFRLKVGSIMSSEADFGSNSERFWFWIRMAPTKHIYYTKHEDIDIVQKKMPIPFRPDWVMDALMIPQIDPSTAREVASESPGSRFTIFVLDEAGNGSNAVQRMIWVDHCHGDVVKQVINDARGQTIASAEYSAHNRDRATGIRMAHSIVLNWPQQKASMTISMGDITVNPVDFAPQTWQFPKYNGYTPFDMANDSVGRMPTRPVGFAKPHSPHHGLSRPSPSQQNGYRLERPNFSDDHTQRPSPEGRTRIQRGARLSPAITPISHVRPIEKPDFAED